jgi:hypothetical protein
MAVFPPGTFVTIASDTDSDAVLTSAWAGKVVALTDGYDLPERGSLIGIPGWRRGAAPDLQWVISGPTNIVDQFIDSIPGAGGWRDQVAREGYKTTAQQLANLGVPRTAIRTRLPQLYAWAVSNDRTPT